MSCVRHRLAGLWVFANPYATDHQVSKIHMQPLVCKINVFSDVEMLVDEGGQAMIIHVASGQSPSPSNIDELNYIICDRRRVSAEVQNA